MTERFELTLTLHGMDTFNDDVDAVVFARKLKVFLQGIRDADKAANGKPRHRLFLTELRKNTATASVRSRSRRAAATSVGGEVLLPGSRLDL